MCVFVHKHTLLNITLVVSSSSRVTVDGTALLQYFTIELQRISQLVVAYVAAAEVFVTKKDVTGNNRITVCHCS